MGSVSFPDFVDSLTSPAPLDGTEEIPLNDNGTAKAIPTSDFPGVVDYLRPTLAIAQTFPRSTNSVTNGSVLSSGRLSLVAVQLYAGQTVTDITFLSATQAAVTPTNQWFCLYSSARAKLAVTANDTSTAWAANSTKTLTLTSPYVITSTNLYYLGIVVTAGTVPTLAANAQFNAAINGITPILSGTSTTGLTTPAGAPDPAAALTAAALVPYAYAR